MKALFYPAFGELEVRDQPAPVLQRDEVLVKVSACGICGSELETFHQQSNRRMPPLIMGHEFSGVVVETGAEVTGFEKGTGVVSNSIVSCGTCTRCLSGETNLCSRRQVFGMHRNGAFAEYVNVPQSCLFQLPHGVSPDAACLTEPLANGVHLVARSRHVPLKNLVIFGAGSIGLLVQQAFQSLRGAATIVVDLKDERLAVAERLGAVRTINPAKEDLTERINEFTQGKGVDGAIDAAGTATTIQQALQVVRPGGVLLLIGLLENARALASYDIILAEKQVIGSYAATKHDMQQALQLIADGRVDVTSWIQYAPLQNGKEAFCNMLNRDSDRIKQVLVMRDAL